MTSPAPIDEELADKFSRFLRRKCVVRDEHGIDYLTAAVGDLANELARFVTTEPLIQKRNTEAVLRELFDAEMRVPSSPFQYTEINGAIRRFAREKGIDLP